MRRNVYLSKHFLKQFDVKTFQKIIITFLNIVDEFELLLNSRDYQINFDNNNEIKVGGSKKPSSSIVESLLFNEYDNREKKEQLLLKYRDGFNSLNEEERKVFRTIYVEGKTNAQASSQLLMYNDKINIIKMSAVVKFCIKTGLDQFVYLFK